MIYQDSNLAQRSRLYELLEELKKQNEECKRSLEVEKILRGHREMQKSFAYMLRIKAPVTLQEQWVNEDRARFNAWLDEERFPYVYDYRSIPFEKWLGPKAGGQISTPATTNIRPKKIVNLAEEQRPPIFSVETESVVGLEENVQVSKPQIDSENDSSEECSNDEQEQYTTSDHKTTSIDMASGDMVLDAETMTVDMVIGDKADIEISHSAKLFELKAEIGEIIMPGGHNNCSTHSAAESGKYFAKSKIFGENFLFGLRRNQLENFDIKRSRLGVKHRWPPPEYGSATFIFI
ncbi:hypothetical protein FF1_017745 [Malus domestica]